MADVKINIVSKSDNSAINSTIAAVEKLDGKLKNAQKFIDQSQRTAPPKLAAAESASAFQDAFKKKDAMAQEATDMAGALAHMTREAKSLTPAIEASGKAAGVAALKKKDLKDIIKALGHAVPELGSLVLALKNPYVILAAAVAGAVVWLKSFLDKVDEMEKAVDAFDQLNKAATPLKAIADANAVASKKQADAIAEIANKSDDATTALGKLIGKIEEKEKLDKEIRDAQQKQEEAIVDADLQTGAIDKFTAIDRRSAIRTKYGQAELGEGKRIAAQKAEAFHLSRLQAVQEEGAIRFALPGAKDAKQEAENAAAANKLSRDVDRDALNKREKALNEDETNAKMGFVKAVAPGQYQMTGAEKLSEIRAERDDIKNKRAELDRFDKKDDLNANLAGEYVSKLETAQQAAQTRIGDISGQSRSTLGSLDAANANASTVFGINSTTRMIEDNSAKLEEVKRIHEEKAQLMQKFVDGIFDATKKGDIREAKILKDKLDQLSVRPDH